MVTSIVPFFAARSSVTLPVVLPKMPRCCENPICVTSNVGVVCRRVEHIDFLRERRSRRQNRAKRDRGHLVDFAASMPPLKELRM